MMVDTTEFQGLLDRVIELSESIQEADLDNLYMTRSIKYQGSNLYLLKDVNSKKKVRNKVKIGDYVMTDQLDFFQCDEVIISTDHKGEEAERSPLWNKILNPSKDLQDAFKSLIKQLINVEEYHRGRLGHPIPDRVEVKKRRVEPDLDKISAFDEIPNECEYSEESEDLDLPF